MKFTLLLAVDMHVGTVAHWLFPGNVDEAKFVVFIHMLLAPNLAHQTPGRQRLIMYDNLSSHCTGNVEPAINAHGHIAMLRPVHSPDFGPVEFAFSNLDMWLQKMRGSIGQHNLWAMTNFWTTTLTGEKMKGYFAKCHYPVVGRLYTPYV